MNCIRKLLLAVKGVCSFLISCLRKQFVEGGLYSTPAENGSYRVLKILKVDHIGVHVRFYSNQYDQAPIKIDESALFMVGLDRKPEEALGAGHLPISKMHLATWGVRYVQQSTVTEDELDGYRKWLEDGGAYF